MEFITGVFQHGNYLAAAIATLATFALGFVWYHPAVFGTIWMKGIGMTAEDAKKGNMPAIFGVTAVVTFLAALAISAMGGGGDAVAGLKFGLMVGIFWCATNHVMHAMFEQRPANVVVLGAAHDIVQYGLLGLIVGLF